MNKKSLAAIIFGAIGAIVGVAGVGAGIASTNKDNDDKAAENALKEADDKFIENNHDYNEEDVEQDQ